MSPPPPLPEWQKLSEPLSYPETQSNRIQRPHATSNLFDGCIATDACTCVHCSSCHESIFNQCAKTEDCKCILCAPIFSPTEMADNLQRLRCLLLSIIHSEAITADRILIANCASLENEEAQLLSLQENNAKGPLTLNDSNSQPQTLAFFGKILRRVILQGTKDERTRSSLDLSGSKICLPVKSFLIPTKGSKVIFTLHTDNIVNGYYAIQASIVVQDGEGNIVGQMAVKNSVDMSITKDFDTFHGTCHYSAKGEFRYHEPLTFTVSFTFKPAVSLGGKNIEDFDNYPAIINLLRAITELSFDKQGNAMPPHIRIQERIRVFEKLGIQLLGVGSDMTHFSGFLFPRLSINVWETHQDENEERKLKEIALVRQGLLVATQAPEEEAHSKAQNSTTSTRESARMEPAKRRADTVSDGPVKKQKQSIMEEFYGAEYLKRVGESRKTEGKKAGMTSGGRVTPQRWTSFPVDSVDDNDEAPLTATKSARNQVAKAWDVPANKSKRESDMSDYRNDDEMVIDEPVKAKIRPARKKGPGKPPESSRLPSQIYDSMDMDYEMGINTLKTPKPRLFNKPAGAFSRGPKSQAIGGSASHATNSKGRNDLDVDAEPEGATAQKSRSRSRLMKAVEQAQEQWEYMNDDRSRSMLDIESGGVGPKKYMVKLSFKGRTTQAPNQKENIGAEMSPAKKVTFIDDDDNDNDGMDIDTPAE